VFGTGNYADPNSHDAATWMMPCNFTFPTTFSISTFAN
jgi:hypothetical protein